MGGAVMAATPGHAPCGDAALLYRSPRAWAKSALYNILGGATFSSDATVRNYANDVCNIVPVKAEL
jgi:glucan phosphorylase